MQTSNTFTYLNKDNYYTLTITYYDDITIITSRYLNDKLYYIVFFNNNILLFPYSKDRDLHYIGNNNFYMINTGKLVSNLTDKCEIENIYI
jgi:hypothetical protein